MLEKEAKSREIKIPGIDEDMAMIYLQFLYTGELVTGHENDGAEGGKRFDNWVQHTLELTRMAMVAEFFRDKALANEVIDALIPSTDEFDLLRNPKALRLVDTLMLKSTGFYNAAVDIIHRFGDKKYLLESKNELPKDLMFDVVARLMDRRDSTKDLIAD